jgi:Phage Mu protein F like protein
MPYHFERDEKACSAAKPWAVKNYEGDLFGCHATTVGAVEQMQALYAEEQAAQQIRIEVAALDARSVTAEQFASLTIGAVKHTLHEAATSLGEVASVDDLAIIPQAWERRVDSTLMPKLSEIYHATAESTTEAVAEAAAQRKNCLLLQQEGLDAQAQAQQQAEENLPVAQIAAAGYDQQQLQFMAPDAGECPQVYSPDNIQILPIAESVAEERLLDARMRLRRASQEVWAAARAELVIGLHEGEGIDQLAARITGSVSFSQYRAEMIARTEVISVSNQASLDAARAAGIQMQKEWLATPGVRTRITHADATGQRVDLDKPFIVDGEHLDYPGDPSGSAHNIINCRCTVVYSLPGDSLDKLGETTVLDHDRVIDAANRFHDIPQPGEAVSYASKGKITREDLIGLGFSKYDPRIDQILSFDDVIARRFGHGFDGVELIDKIDNPWTYAWTRTENMPDGTTRTILGMNPEHLTQESVARDEANGFHPRTRKPSFIDCLVHEQGHLEMMSPRGLPWFNPLTWGGEMYYGPTAGRWRGARDAAYAAMRDAGGPTSAKVLGKRISRYAQQDRDEMEAELWTWYHMGARRPAWVKAWGNAYMSSLGLDPTPLCHDLKLC